MDDGEFFCLERGIPGSRNRQLKTRAMHVGGSLTPLPVDARHHASPPGKLRWKYIPCGSDSRALAIAHAAEWLEVWEQWRWVGDKGAEG